MTTIKTHRLRREALHARVLYRGRMRPVVVILDLQAGTVAVRPKACRRAKTYLFEDLCKWGPQLSLL